MPTFRVTVVLIKGLTEIKLFVSLHDLMIEPWQKHCKKMTEFRIIFVPSIEEYKSLDNKKCLLNFIFIFHKIFNIFY